MYHSTPAKRGRKVPGWWKTARDRKKAVKKNGAKKNPSWRKFKKEARKRLGVVGKKVKAAVKAVKKNPARKNPEDSAHAAYVDFHGKEPSVDIIVDTPVHFHKVLAGMARLVAFDVKRNVDGGKTTIKFDRNTYLTESEKKDQIFIRSTFRAETSRLSLPTSESKARMKWKCWGKSYRWTTSPKRNT